MTPATLTNSRPASSDADRAGHRREPGMDETTTPRAIAAGECPSGADGPGWPHWGGGVAGDGGVRLAARRPPRPQADFGGVLSSWAADGRPRTREGWKGLKWKEATACHGRLVAPFSSSSFVLPPLSTRHSPDSVSRCWPSEPASRAWARWVARHRPRRAGGGHSSPGCIAAAIGPLILLLATHRACHNPAKHANQTWHTSCAQRRWSEFACCRGDRCAMPTRPWPPRGDVFAALGALVDDGQGGQGIADFLCFRVLKKWTVAPFARHRARSHTAARALRRLHERGLLGCLQRARPAPPRVPTTAAVPTSGCLRRARDGAPTSAARRPGARTRSVARGAPASGPRVAQPRPRPSPAPSPTTWPAWSSRCARAASMDEAPSRIRREAALYPRHGEEEEAIVLTSPSRSSHRGWRSISPATSRSRGRTSWCTSARSTTATRPWPWRCATSARGSEPRLRQRADGAPRPQLRAGRAQAGQTAPHSVAYATP